MAHAASAGGLTGVTFNAEASQARLPRGGNLGIAKMEKRLAGEAAA